MSVMLYFEGRLIFVSLRLGSAKDLCSIRDTQAESFSFTRTSLIIETWNRIEPTAQFLMPFSWALTSAVQTFGIRAWSYSRRHCACRIGRPDFAPASVCQCPLRDLPVDQVRLHCSDYDRQSAEWHAGSHPSCACTAMLDNNLSINFEKWPDKYERKNAHRHVTVAKNTTANCRIFCNNNIAWLWR